MKFEAQAVRPGEVSSANASRHSTSTSRREDVGDIKEFNARYGERISQLNELGKAQRSNFLGMMLAAVYLLLTVFGTTDTSLIAAAEPIALPILNFSVPLPLFYVTAPAVLAIMYCHFHLSQEPYWESVAQLPPTHADGRTLDRYVSGSMFSGAVIRSAVLPTTRLKWNLPTWLGLEALLTLAIGWGVVPIVLVFCWARYLTAHDWTGTTVHVGLVFATLWVSARTVIAARRHLSVVGSEISLTQTPRQYLTLGRAFLVIVLLTLVYLSAAAINSRDSSYCKSADFDWNCALLSPGSRFWRIVHFNPHSEISEQSIFAKPKNFKTLLTQPAGFRDYLDAQKRLTLSGRSFRRLQAERAYLPNLNLIDSIIKDGNVNQAIFTNSKIKSSTFLRVSMKDTDFRYSRLFGVNFKGVIAPDADFSEARFSEPSDGFKEQGEVRGTSFNGDFTGAIFSGVMAGTSELSFLGRDPDDTTNMVDSIFSGSIIHRAKFAFVNLNRAVFSNESELVGGNFKAIKFDGASITQSYFTRSEFRQCRFGQCNYPGHGFQRIAF